jgi:hypothetical protein
MKAKLIIPERIGLLSILPREGDITTIRLVRELRESLSFTEEENQKHNIRLDNGMLTYNNIGETPKEFEVGDTMKSLISKSLKDLDKEKKLIESHIPIWEKFVDEA